MKKLREIDRLCQTGSWEALQEFIQIKENTHYLSEIYGGDTGFCHIVIKLVEHGHAHCLSDYLNGYGDALCPGYSDGWTRRHLAVEEAAKEGQLDCLKLLLSDCTFAESLSPGITPKMSMRQFAFITALEYGKAACLIFLLSEGGLGDIPYSGDDLAPTWRHYAFSQLLEKGYFEGIDAFSKDPDFAVSEWPHQGVGDITKVIAMFRGKSREELETCLGVSVIKFVLYQFHEVLTVKQFMVLSEIFEGKGFALGLRMLRPWFNLLMGDEASWQKSFESMSNCFDQYQFLMANLNLGHNEEALINRLKPRLDCISWEQLMGLLKVVVRPALGYESEVLNKIVEIKMPSMSLSQLFECQRCFPPRRPNIAKIAKVFEQELKQRFKDFMAMSPDRVMTECHQDYSGVMLLMGGTVDCRSFNSLEFESVLGEIRQYKRDQLPSDFQARRRFIFKQLKGRYVKWQREALQRQFICYLQRIVMRAILS